MTKTKSFPAFVKAAGEVDGLPEGEFHAIVSVFDNVDSYGDVVLPGAFTDTLAAWAEKGDPIPVIWSHRWDDPDCHVGVVVAAEERETGLWVHGRIDIDADAPLKAKQVHRLLKGRRVTQFSFAYDVTDAGWGKRDDREVYELRALDIHEVGPCLIGANQETELLAAKASASEDTDGPWQALVDHAKSTGQIDRLTAALNKTTEDGQPGAATATEGDDGHAGSAAPDQELTGQAIETEPGERPMPLSPASALLRADLIEA